LNAYLTSELDGG